MMSSKQKILIVDDNKAQREWLRLTVEDALRSESGEYPEIVAVGSQAEAERAIRENAASALGRFDLVICDLFLTHPPVAKEGFAVLRLVKERLPATRRILVSGKISIVSDPQLKEVVEEFVYIGREGEQGQRRAQTLSSRVRWLLESVDTVNNG